MTPPMTNDLIERLRARAYQSEKAARRHDKALATAPGSYASDFRQWSREETESATLDRQAAAHIEALADELARLQSDASEIMAANTELATENTALAERVRELEGALDLATADRTTYYLRCAHRRLETIAEAMPDDLGLSLGNLALADERDWLDCHIDWLERTARQARKDKENG